MNNNDRKDFFTGAGFDEPGMNGQPMNNGMSVDNGMNGQPMNNPNMGMPMNNGMMNQGMNNSGMMNNNMGMMNNQQMPNQQPMMSNNMGMNQQPMNNGMMNGQPVMNQQPMNSGGVANQFGSKGVKLNNKMILIGVLGVAVIAVLLVFFVFHKTLSCTTDEEIFGVNMEMKVEASYWFGKITSAKAEMTVDFSDYDEDDFGMDLDEYKEQFLESFEDEDDYKIKDKGDVVVITMNEYADMDDLLEDDSESYDDAVDYFEDIGFTCK